MTFHQENMKTCHRHFELGFSPLHRDNSDKIVLLGDYPSITGNS